MSNSMKTFYLLVFISLLPVVSSAQQVYNTLLRTNPALQTALIDSLNKKGKLMGKSNPGKLAAALNDTARQLFYRHVNSVYGPRQLQQLSRSYQMFGDTAKISSYVAGKLRGFYALRNESEASAFMKAGAYANDFKLLSGSAFYDNTPGAVVKSGVGVQLEDRVVVGNIPVNIVYNSLAGTSPFDKGLMGQQLKKFSFDKDVYLQRMNGYLNKAYDLKKYFLGDIDVTTAVKSFASKQLTDIQNEMKAMTDPSQAAAFNNLTSPEQLIYLDSSQIRQLLLSDKTLQLTAEDLNGNVAAGMDSVSAHGKTVMAARHYLSRIETLKTSVVQGLQARETLSAEHQATGDIRQRINDPEAQKRSIKELLPLNFLQRLLLQAKSLNIGNIAANGSKGGVRDLFMSGVQGSFLNKGSFLMLGLGTTRQGGDIRDQNFSSSLDPGAYSMQFLQMGKGDISETHSHVALMNANTKNKDYRQFNASSLKRNIFVGAFSEKMDLGEYGSITADISKSNNEFNNAATGNSYALSSKTAAFTLLNDFWQTVSAGLDYSGEWKAQSMSQRLYLNYSGLAYTNPGSPGGSRGTIRYGLNVKRYWNKRKVMVGFRTDMQDMNTSATTASGWRNRQYTLDTRIKVKKNFSLSTRMGQSTMKSTSERLFETGYLSRQINVSSQLSGKLFSRMQNNNVSFGLQQMDILPMKSLLVNLNINHSVVINTHVLTVSVFYNKDVKDQALYGNLFTAETGWSYQLGKIWSCTSGINYLDNKDVVRQIGILQTVSAALLDRLQVNLYADCRKQLLNTPQNYLFGNISTQLALNYQLNR
ncbi:hypothetical protein QFZ48_005850 [Chitinophaga sp. W2I13]|uniref:hypothetical protein n=1 Tax=Chitinophaga sp. W2I13 TaxID=3373923 RepID=UPI003D23204D